MTTDHLKSLAVDALEETASLREQVLAQAKEIERLTAELATSWQPIETAPKGVAKHGKMGVCWLMLAWPDGEEGWHTASGMRVGEQFFAAATFYTGGPFKGKQYLLRELEVTPTHWMPSPKPPRAALSPAAQEAPASQATEEIDEWDCTGCENDDRPTCCRYASPSPKEP